MTVWWIAAEPEPRAAKTLDFSHSHIQGRLSLPMGCTLLRDHAVEKSAAKAAPVIPH